MSQNADREVTRWLISLQWRWRGRVVEFEEDSYCVSIKEVIPEVGGQVCG